MKPIHTPLILRTKAEWTAYRAALPGTVGFVPTMGALHAGHASLLHAIRPKCDHLILSIFVNPTQFGPNEDFSKYPRTFEADLQLAAEAQVDAIFYPSTEDLYPVGFSTYLEESVRSRPLCGPFRPGHFRGVTTVVYLLFQLVRPHLAAFGLKDAQQYWVIRKMVEDLLLPIEILGVPTLREDDGLAMSSRNRYLAPVERKMAAEIYQSLSRIQIGFNPTQAQARIETEKSHLTALGFKIQYLEAVTLPDLAPLSTSSSESPAILIAIAAYLGTTRLIDNVVVPPNTRKDT